MKPEAYTHRAKAVRVIDGDTIVADIDLWFGFTFRTSLRLLGINCPEMRTPAGPPARQFTMIWLARAGDLKVRSVGPDKYGGRWVAVVSRADGSTLNDALVTAGHAVKMNDDGSAVKASSLDDTDEYGLTPE